MQRFLVSAVITIAAIASIASTRAVDDDGGASVSTVSFELENQYAESIFNVTWEVPDADGLDDFEGDANGIIASDLRLDVFESTEVADAFRAPSSTAIHIAFTGRSLGEDNEFDVIELQVPEEANEETLCRLEYDYDLANAAFTVRHGCN